MNKFDPFLAAAAVGGTQTAVATVLTGEHPSLTGRVRVGWTDEAGTERAMWALALAGTVARAGDRVLLSIPSNSDEVILTGVIDPVRPRDVPRDKGPQLQLRADEALCIAGPDGAPWLEVQATPGGPRVKLLVGMDALSVPGKLKLSGDAVEIEARQGEVTVDASADVVIKGEIVQMN